VLWIACCNGDKDLVGQILALPGQVRDDPAPDGTTAFIIALAKGRDDIVKIIVDLNIEPREQMLALYREAQEVGLHTSSAKGEITMRKAHSR
jgi:ankyrin repeat protein